MRSDTGGTPVRTLVRTLTWLAWKVRVQGVPNKALQGLINVVLECAAAACWAAVQCAVAVSHRTRPRNWLSFALEQILDGACASTCFRGKGRTLPHDSLWCRHTLVQQYIHLAAHDHAPAVTKPNMHMLFIRRSFIQVLEATRYKRVSQVWPDGCEEASGLRKITRSAQSQHAAQTG